eukprot:CAMPEP_0185754208 /NCGR_PEP_ID=MMETSP1174-20130828/12852_1 /TAXON_ID=35687 /ORGANISM="Dictyocha speculum, Strain CCMP1381" /LENGTH=43 /DNA_ID= /DNA_START= /DNA_END= /DNA_ORIENTATION=
MTPKNESKNDISDRKRSISVVLDQLQEEYEEEVAVVDEIERSV